ncbi:PepSY domain-containing protein [Thiocapsa roseopersicina]|uniref:Peptidase propeptide and YPEB domain-containing protein n=1 Tax=Thiocapsa roseopersicina TaxID=1058 RepID=A0A1H2ZKE0_THIRO|nr:PepSY domain-containing protein [Thiocapsa roseopersicina]SDX17264.1 Peptidase propeptide and YPEB domain-containing protein [Thiocapsa roseopersicina]
MRSTRLVLAMLLVVVAVAMTGTAWARKDDSRQGQMSPGQAEAAARRQTGGGRVLSVKPSDGGYQVKVLTPSGEVKYVFVSGR